MSWGVVVVEKHAVREIEVTAFNQGSPNYWVTSEMFSEYDGNTIYNSFTMDGSVATIVSSFEPGVARVDDPLGSPTTSYYHADKLGTTRGMTISSSTLEDISVYTAFGELVEGTNHRYGYVGKEGYQSHDQFALLHVGARYYDPSTGRFAQRDPIGIDGGHNVYSYARSRPTDRVDPSGHYDEHGWDIFYDKHWPKFSQADKERHTQMMACATGVVVASIAPGIAATGAGVWATARWGGYTTGDTMADSAGDAMAAGATIRLLPKAIKRAAQEIRKAAQLVLDRLK